MGGHLLLCAICPELTECGEVKVMEMIARIAYPRVKARRILQEEAIKKIATIELDGLVQVARSCYRAFFEDLCIEPDRCEWVTCKLVSIAHDPIDTRIKATQLGTYLGEYGFKGVARTLFIHFPAEQG